MEEAAALVPEISGETETLRLCANCGAQTAGVYCRKCGQKHRTPHDLKLRHFFRHVFEEFTHFDSKAFISVTSLLFRPGKLTSEWMAGKEKSYIQPLRLFLFINIGYFIFVHFWPVSTLINPLAVQYDMQIYSKWTRPYIDAKIKETGLTFKKFEQYYDVTSAEESRELVILLVPLFASLLALLMLRQRPYLVEHLIFSLHFCAFFLVMCSIGLMLVQALTFGVLIGLHISPTALDWEALSTFVPAVIFVIYLAVALRRVYRVSWVGSALRSVVLTYGIFWVLTAYRLILLFLVLRTMHTYQ